jgi:histone deacetylase 1/2
MSDHKVKAVCTDGAKEYDSEKYRNFLKKNGIRKETSAPYQQSQNGLAECHIQTVNRGVACLLQQASASIGYWGEAATYFVDIDNATPSADNNISPMELAWKKKPKYHRFHPWGCKAFATIPVTQQKKFQPKAHRCVFLGFAENYEAYRLLRMSDRKIIISNDVTFNHKIFPFKEKKDKDEQSSSDDVYDYQSFIIPETSSIQSDMDHLNASTAGENECGIDLQSVEDRDLPSASLPLSVTPQSEDIAPQLVDVTPQSQGAPSSEPMISRRSIRQITPNKEIFNEDFIFHLQSDEFLLYMDDLQEIEKEPKSYKEAIMQGRKWIEPIEKEYNSLVKNETWRKIARSEVPDGFPIHRPIWRFKIKSNGIYKARLCFDGRFQRQGIDYYETYSPVAKYPSVRMAFYYIIAKGGKIELGDVPNAFLNSDIDTDVYMEFPEGYNYDKSFVCKLNKGLYGLKQASRLWHAEIDRFLINDLQFESLDDDRCIYSKAIGDEFIIVILYVDDIAVGSNSQLAIDTIFEKLQQRFNIKRLGPMDNSHYLGMIVTMSQKGDMIHMSQPHIIEKMLIKHGLSSSTPTKSPYNPTIKLTKDNGDPFNDITLYRNIIGSLFWIARTTRPDIMFVVSILSQYQAAPTEVHYGAAKHVLRYLAGTINHGIVISAPECNTLIGWSDSSHKDIQRDLLSTTGFIISVGPCLISWSSRKQTVRVMSSAAAELIAAFTTMEELLWMKSWTKDMNAQLGNIVNIPPIIILDSYSCIKMIRNHTLDRNQPKFLELWKYNLSDKFKEGEFKLDWISGKDNPADILTKTITSAAHFEKLRNKIVFSNSVVTGECQNKQENNFDN